MIVIFCSICLYVQHLYKEEARLKATKIRQKQKKLFQNWYSAELIIGTLRIQQKQTMRN